MPEWLSDEEQSAWRALLTMTSQLQGILNRDLQQNANLSLSDYDVLVPLSEAPEQHLRIFELGHRLGWEQSRLSHHLTRMVRRGLVRREDCEGDKRGAFVALTEQGRRAISRAAPGHAAAVRHLVFDALSGTQVSTIEQASRRILARIEAASRGTDESTTHGHDKTPG